MDLLLQDLRYGLRRLAGSPGFTLVAVLSLALGIGANTAIFSVVNAVLLRPLAVEAPDRLVEIYTSDNTGAQYATSSYPDYLEVRAATDVFEDVLAYELFVAQAEAPGGPGIVLGELVTGNYFDALGVRFSQGRGFLPEEDATRGANPVVVLGHGYWRRAFAADPSVVGRTVRINRRPFTVVGVVPSSYRGTFAGVEPDLYAPMMMADVVSGGGASRLDSRGTRSLFMKGRLRPGVAPEQAGAAVAAIGRRLAAEYPETNERREMSIVPTRDVSIHPAIDRALVPVAALLLVVVGLVLLIACANLASFLLARAMDRRKEIAVRLALGARRSQVLRQLLLESVLLALTGGAAAVLVAHWAIGMLVSFQPPVPIPVNLDVGIDGRVLGFTLAITVAAGLAFGLLPGLQATRPDVAPTLRDESGGTTGGRRRATLRNALVVGQVAVSLLLLIGSGLFVRSLGKAQRIDPGFYTGAAALLWPNLELSGIDAERGPIVQRQLAERLSALPGVTHVGMADRFPLGVGVQLRGITVDGIEPPPGQETISVDFAQVDAGYFETLEVPIVAGRGFTDADAPGTPRVAIVSEAAAARFWPGSSAVGQTFHLGASRDEPVTVVGVARDTKVRTLGEAPRPYIYLNATQRYVSGLEFVVRGEVRGSELVAMVRRAALEVDPDLVIMEAKTMDEHLALLLFPPRMAALLLSVFGGLALLLAAIGLYGVVSYSVARRKREVGVRLALGATMKDVVLMLTGGGLRLVLIGGAIGLALAAAVSWLISGYLYGIGATDLVTFVGVPLVLGAVGLLAAWVPARRAAGVDPMRALRAE